MTDEKIITLFYKRDEQAIENCIILYGNYCKAIASGILANPADTEKVVADTWLAAWNAIPPQNPNHLRLFLGRITRNLAIDKLRKSQAISRGSGETTLALDELSEITGNYGTEEHLDKEELSKAISAYLSTEPQIRRCAFVLRYFYLESIPSIAQRLQRKESAVRMMLSRTRKGLKNFLIQEGYDL